MPAPPLLAVQLFEDHQVSLGQAAEIAGYSHRAFPEPLIALDGGGVPSGTPSSHTPTAQART